MNVLTDRGNMVADELAVALAANPPNGDAHADAPAEDEPLVLPPVPEQLGAPAVPLAHLIDLAVQETYKQWTLMLELIDRRQDSDRKIMLIDFTRRTRAYFLKLYAVVKWVRVGRPLDQLTASICYVLDQLGQQYVETADILARVAREELVFARLPTFQVSTAVDVLSLGTMRRLPTVIKSAHIRPRPLSKRQTVLTMRYVEQMIEHRLGQEAHELPPGFSDVRIRNGMAIFTVPHEFEIRMTLMREAVAPLAASAEPPAFDYEAEMKRWHWTLLDLRVLVVDHEVGLGAPLLHARQNHELIRVCRTAMQNAANAVRTVYELLHDFCMKLQLDLLFCHAQSLSQSISSEYVRVDAYDPMQGSLSISYWARRRPGTSQSTAAAPFKILVNRDKTEEASGLKLRHQPPVDGLPSIHRSEGQPQFHSLFTKTILFRCRERLENVKRLFATIGERSAAVRLLDDAAIRLVYRVLPAEDTTSEEWLHVAVNTFSGRIVCEVPGLEERAAGCASLDEDNRPASHRAADHRCDEIMQLEEALNADCRPENEAIERALRRLHVLLLLRRFARTAADHHFRPLSAARATGWLDKWDGGPRDRLYLEFDWEPHHVVVLTLELEPSLDVRVQLFLADWAKQHVDVPREEWREGGKIASSKVQLHELTTADIVSETVLGNLEATGLDVREFFLPNGATVSGSRQQIRAAVSSLADRLLVVRLGEQLRKRGVRYAPVEHEPTVGGLRLRFTDFAEMLHAETAIPADSRLFENLVSCSLRLDSQRLPLRWQFECTMRNVPLVADYLKTYEEVDVARTSCFSNVQEVAFRNTWSIAANANLRLVDGLQNNVIDRVKIFAHMFDLAERFALGYEQYFNRCCSILSFTYQKLQILYGRRREWLLSISYKVTTPGFRLHFAQASGWDELRPCNNKWNAHTMVAAQLCAQLNTKPENDESGSVEAPPSNPNELSEFGGPEDPVLAVVNYVVNTERSLNTIVHFARPRLRSLKGFSQMLSIDKKTAFQAENQCHLIVVSPTRLVLVFGCVHMEFCLLAGNRVAVEASLVDDQHRAVCVPLLGEFWAAHGRHVGDQVLIIDPAAGEEDAQPQAASNPLSMEGSSSFNSSPATDSAYSSQAVPVPFVPKDLPAGALGDEPKEIIRMRQASGGAGRLQHQKSRTTANSPVCGGKFPAQQQPSGANPQESPQPKSAAAPSAHLLQVNSPPPRPTSAPAAAARINTPPSAGAAAERNDVGGSSGVATSSEMPAASTQIPTFILGAELLESAMGRRILARRNPYNVVDDNPNHMRPMSPMDEYLEALNFYTRLGVALSEMARSVKRAGPFPLSAVHYGPGFVDMRAVAFRQPGSKVEPWKIQLYAFICPQTFSARCRLEFTGPVVPEADHVRAFENYFRMCVVPLGNEMAVLSFVTACRIMVDGVFAAFARLMETEILGCANEEDEDELDLFWKVCMPMAVTNRLQPGEQAHKVGFARRFVAGVIVNETCKHLLITLALQTPRLAPTDPVVARKVELVYVLPTNILTIRNVFVGEHSSDGDKKRLEALMNELNDEPADGCRLWPAIRRILDRYRP
ncbi:Mediator of RNA polymerase II transcription subunit 14 [Aphelenchoides fujianensis]|nr:Mediator of RNA polymerase II transcription subunit 14 [Aphelenchoides fujianensis]